MTSQCECKISDAGSCINTKKYNEWIAGEVLEEERVGAHQLTEGNRLFAQCHSVADAEGVEDGSEQHVLTDESQETVALHDRQRVLQVAINATKAENLRHWVTQHEHDENRNWNDQVPHLALDQHHKEAGVQESV
eukprot:CAMPEP_0170459890 /NCGR_PEP_ID=MMETSP0123-20130129/6432_1 /TAXON_ID=182087 /ORGANISM="Favella ehrenbergii, Strain Fehren 1" /LENGTH=134 /DNA_ID=CAMNT_0010724635 /DNA_START=643 /DNA_END=1049 /DNA_ORIENTATION=-